MKNKVRKRRVRKNHRGVEEEFPNDFAMQQVLMVRKIIAKEVEEKGLSYLEYIKQYTKELEVV